MSAWILRLVGISMISSAALAIAPGGAGKRMLRVVCGFALLSAMLSAVVSIKWEDYSMYLEQYRQAGEELSTKGERQTQIQTRLIIQDQCAAYILDRANELDMKNCHVSVRAKWSSEGYWVPVECAISAGTTQEGRRELTGWIEANLGIPAGAQEWQLTGETLTP